MHRKGVTPIAEIRENVIEWISGSKEISCTLTQRRYINKVRKLRDKQPEIVSVFVENDDGSIFCRLPLKALKLYLRTSEAQADEEDDEDEE